MSAAGTGDPRAFREMPPGDRERGAVGPIETAAQWAGSHQTLIAEFCQAGPVGDWRDLLDRAITGRWHALLPPLQN
jgi:hypothetical protein